MRNVRRTWYDLCIVVFKVNFVLSDRFVKQKLYIYLGLKCFLLLLATVSVTNIQYATEVQFRDTERQPRICRREVSESSGLLQSGQTSWKTGNAIS